MSSARKTRLWGRRPSPAGRHRVLNSAAAALALVAVLAFALRLLPLRFNWLVAASSVTPFLMLGAPLAAVVLAYRREWIAFAVAFALTLVCAATQLPLYLARSAGPGVDVRVLQANLKLGQADPATVVRIVRRHRVQIFCAEELTPSERDALRAAGLDRAMRYSVLDPRDGAAGTGIWSTIPLQNKRSVPGYLFALVSATALVPGTSDGVTVAATHMPGPWPQSAAQWNLNMAALPSELRALAAPGRPVLIAGDFNATQDTAQFRHLLRGGFRDAADQAGAGMTRTFPGNSWLPPLIAIDHVLTNDAVARSARTISLPGSDHRALSVTVRIPRG